MPYEIPLQIAIPIPTEIEIGYGVNATGKRGGNLRVRCTNKEYDAIQHEAAILGLSLAMFVRSCSTNVAAQLLKHRETESTSMSAGEDEDGPIQRNAKRPKKQYSDGSKRRTKRKKTKAK